MAICVPLLLQGIELTNEEKRAITNLDHALEKFPKHNGLVKRSLSIPDQKDLQKFVNAHEVGDTVTYNEYIATTCGEVYNPDGQVQIYIPHSKNGRDIRSINSDEQEILYERNSSFEVLNVIQREQGVKIFLREL